ncbi:MAG: YcxB family protein [Phycisphaerales bacterium]
MPDSHDIEFEFTREDYIRYALEGMRPERSPEWARFYRRRRGMLAAAIGSTAVYGTALATNFNGAIDPGNGVVLALGGGVAYFWWWTHRAFNANAPGAIAQALRAAADSADGRRTIGVHRVRLTPSEMQWESKGVRWASPWAQIVSVNDIGSFVLIMAHQNGGIVIPKRVLGTDEATTSFVAAARRLHAAAPAGPVELLGDFLANRDLACPSCGYSLRGLRTDRCPECATHLSVELLTAPSRRADGGQ